eukprot:TRINITY_DN2701_c0_g2_i1.p1 TRINITY_DN2701_c0_g2~~TRINITY_DN2701_c0_g2_i1.p1  ORF type:complete len:190 (+),score=16.53 TRINITY_DN2701_c0_g2_i1:184-753(+)
MFSRFLAQRPSARFQPQQTWNNHESLIKRAYSTATPNPPIELKTTRDAPKDFVSTADYFKNRKVLLVGVVGAFTGVCDNQIPPYNAKLPEFKQHHFDEVAVVSVNDPAVMKAFQKQLGATDLTFLSDFDGAFTRSLGMEVDLSAARLGKRSKRYAMVVENGKIGQTWVEEKPGDLKVSSAETVLKNLEE